MKRIFAISWNVALIIAGVLATLGITHRFVISGICGALIAYCCIEIKEWWRHQA
jgi:hypothetical protein